MQRLTASQVTSRQFRLGFGRKYGRYITELDLSGLCSKEGMDATIAVDALPSLPNVKTVMTPILRNVHQMVLRDALSDGAPYAQQCAVQVHFVMQALFELFASVPSLVVDASAVNDDFFAKLGKKSPQTRQLVLHTDYNSDESSSSPLVRLALDALQKCPRLTELKLAMTGDFEDAEAFRDFALPSECCLQHLAVSVYGDLTAPVHALLGKLSPILRSCELDFQEFPEPHDGGFPEGSQFPHLETLIATTTYLDDVEGFASSIAPAAFPALRRLELRTRSPARPLHGPTLTNLTAAFASRSVPPRIVTDIVFESVSRFRHLDDVPFSAMNRPGGNRRSLVPSYIAYNPYQYRQVALDSRHADFSLYKSRAIDPLLDRMRDMADEALQMTDYVQLTRIAQALQPCELLRVERGA